MSILQNNSIFRYDLKAGKVYAAYIQNESSPSFIAPVDRCNGHFAVGLQNSVKIVQWDGISPIANVIRTFYTVNQNTTSHFNALVDPKGIKSYNEN